MIDEFVICDGGSSQGNEADSSPATPYIYYLTYFDTFLLIHSDHVTMPRSASGIASNIAHLGHGSK
jgi:hypothetical protein